MMKIKHMRSIVRGAFIAALLSCAAEGAAGGRVTVSKVRIFVNAIRYDWVEGDPIPQRAEDGFTAPSTVASFLDVRPGDRMTAEELEARRGRAEERLMESGYFYSAQVLTVPSTASTDARLFVVKVGEGFLWRFGGGAVFAFTGQENVLGLRKSWRVTAGYNRDGASWRDDAVLGGPLFYETGFFYSNELGTGTRDYHLFAAPLSFGVRIGPDLALSLELPISYRVSVPAALPADGFEWAPGIRMGWNTSMGPAAVRLGLTADGSTGISLGAAGISFWRVEGRTSITLGTWPELGVRAAAGAALPIAGDLPAHSLFDLSAEPGITIRSGYAPEDLLAQRFVLCSAELRIPLPRITLGSLFSLSLSPFAYVDAAFAQTSTSGGFRDFEGFGLGVRIGFENPIFAYFALSYGWNPQEAGRFCFFAVPDA
jgi:outer membrane protein assembly factor BamA